MELWYPGAIRDVLPDCGVFAGGPFKGVLHTTEGSSYAGARSAYVKNGSPPHFTVAVEGGRFVARQHIALNRGAKALRNASGVVETNRDSAIQIEIVGFTAQAAQMSPALVAGLAALMRWIEAQTGIKPVYPADRVNTYAAASRVRMSNQAWDNYNGWCGHQHVPENDHYDPGMIPVAQLFTTQVPKVSNAVANPVDTKPRKQGGYYIVGEDGGVFACGGAPFFGSMGGKTLASPIVGIAVTPSGNGYVLVGKDGGVFAFGDASFRGSYPGLPPEARQGDRFFVGGYYLEDGRYVLVSNVFEQVYTF